MTENTIGALLALIGVLGAAGISYLSVAQAATRRKLNRLVRENRALWYYTRHLINWGYKPHRDGEHPPEPPESIRHLYEFGE